MTVSYTDLRERSRKQGSKQIRDIDELINSLNKLSVVTHKELLKGSENHNSGESTQVFNEQYDKTEQLFDKFKNDTSTEITVPKPSLLNYANFDNDNYAVCEEIVSDLIDEYDYKAGLKEKDISENEFDLQYMINQFVEEGDWSVVSRFLQTRMYIVAELNKEDVSILLWTYELYGIIIQMTNESIEEINCKEYINKLMALYNKLDLKIEQRRNLIKQNIKFFIKALKIVNNEERQILLTKILQNEVLDNDIQLLIESIEDLYYIIKPNETKKLSAQTFIEGALYFIDGYGNKFKPDSPLIENGGFVKNVQLPPNLTEFHPILKCSVSKTEINNTANSLRRLGCGHLFGKRPSTNGLLLRSMGHMRLFSILCKCQKSHVHIAKRKLCSRI